MYWAKASHVVGGSRSCQERGMFGRQREPQRRRLHVDHPRGNHRAQPLANITLVETSQGRDFLRGGGLERAHDVEQARAVADRQHQTEGAVIECG
jgi:hypothetical protein